VNKNNLITAKLILLMKDKTKVNNWRATNN